MLRLDVLLTGQVGDGAGQLEDAVIGCGVRSICLTAARMRLLQPELVQASSDLQALHFGQACLLAAYVAVGFGSTTDGGDVDKGHGNSHL